MSRFARKNMQGPFVHVIVQGINKELIFNNDNYKDCYKFILKKYLKDSNVLVLAYCIMSNHAHILLYSNNINDISSLMRKVNTSYAQFYNGQNKRVGYVFRDRYYTQMIKSEEHLYNCFVYIHKNPVNANMVDNERNYKHSSYMEYIKKTKELISEKSIEIMFNDTNGYLNKFYQIHNRANIEDVADIIERKESSQIVQDFLKSENKCLEDIKKNEELFSELLLKLRHDGGLSLRTMSGMFDINKDKLNKIINRNL